ncbi:MAG: PspA/IM30 family protein [Myxococcales bacterium]|nr:PspA/IM30 family protein [Myxococcales bacterium]MCB9751880.1 PspA/IM30 family protein [Myxococcales bacterium]
MGLFSRIGTLFRSNINELINKAEDPEKMLNQVLVDMKSQLVEAKKQVAVAIADEKRLKKQYETEAAKAADWEKKAMLAVRAGDDNLARAALGRKKSHAEIAATLKQQWDAQKESVEKLKEALRGLDSKIEEAKRKRNMLVSRAKRAEAQRTINETLNGINNTSAFDTFERMADRVTQLEAEAEATSEMSAALTEGVDTSLESQFKALEAGPGVDDELERLKSQMALKAAESKQITEGASAQDVRAEAQADAGGEPPPLDDDAAAEAAISEAELDSQLEELKRKLSAE